MASVDLVDETFIAAPADVLAPIVADPARWREWWPDLQLTVFMDRGASGQRWSIIGALVGSCEIWLEPVLDGTLVHYYLRASPSGATPHEASELPDDPAGWRKAARLREERAKAWKHHVWALKDELEPGRAPGMPPPPESPSVDETPAAGGQGT